MLPIPVFFATPHYHRRKIAAARAWDFKDRLQPCLELRKERPPDDSVQRRLFFSCVEINVAQRAEFEAADLGPHAHERKLVWDDLIQRRGEFAAGEFGKIRTRGKGGCGPYNTETGRVMP